MKKAAYRPRTKGSKNKEKIKAETKHIVGKDENNKKIVSMVIKIKKSK